MHEVQPRVQRRGRHLGIASKVYVNRGYEFPTPEYGHREIATIAELPGLVGLQGGA